ncbi:hypothetical protein [Burkholderia cepacia]|uniref:hypothetical protein n=1 Tax=Burkholderia cepacia TaxID=292 RepID=UPI002ABDC117|nr:hypothetical protein [Burkholderia cepacia]
MTTENSRAAVRVCAIADIEYSRGCGTGECKFEQPAAAPIDATEEMRDAAMRTVQAMGLIYTPSSDRWRPNLDSAPAPADERVSETSYWVIHEKELLHVMSVAIGAAYVHVPDAAKRLNLKTVSPAASAKKPADERAAFAAWSGMKNTRWWMNITPQQAAEAAWQARAASATETGAEGPKRGTREQIAAERKLTCEAIDGAMAFGYQNTNPPPSADHWLAPYWHVGRKQAELESRSPTMVPVAWKTTHPAVCVPITEDREIAEQWRAHGYQVIEFFDRPVPAMEAEAADELPHWFEIFLTNVCELPDRNSPEGEPDAIVATLDELRNCALNAIEQCVSYAVPVPAMATGPARAWETDDGRVISDEQKQGALRDGGASASSVRPYSIALGRIGAVPAMAAEAVAYIVSSPEGDGLVWARDRHHVRADLTLTPLAKVADPQPAQASARQTLDELRATVCAVGVVGSIDGHDVIRRASAIELIDRRRALLQGANHAE